ncbi:MAG: T9SS type A sorting domain-containing protein, partial [Chitinivibrionales bacterium]|nr:T9SS type A sorting domain-containing protein [Chitinivibrionales bacterium]MBD3358258.1 T9SS type A sorting domain-containing protein [Chitinivibrionales bacterium]
DVFQGMAHGNEDSYEGIRTSDIKREGCAVRVCLNNSCYSGTLGGIVNHQILADGTLNVISVGATTTVVGGYHVFPYDDRDDRGRGRHLGYGRSWGDALIVWPQSNRYSTIIYGDLSLPSMMYPPEPQLPGRSTNERPLSETLLADLDADLSWTARVGTESHRVYFGTDSSLGESSFRGTTVENEYDPGRLEPGTTYYWRVEAVNDHGSTVGPVWRFMTAQDELIWCYSDSNMVNIPVEAWPPPNRGMRGLLFYIPQPIYIEELRFENILARESPNVGIWRINDTTPIVTFTAPSESTVVTVPVAVELDKGEYFYGALFQRYFTISTTGHQPHRWELEPSPGIWNLRNIRLTDSDSTKDTTFGYHDDMSSTTNGWGQINFGFSIAEPDPVGTKRNNTSGGRSSIRVSLSGSRLLMNGLDRNGSVDVRLFSLSGRTVWRRTIRAGEASVPVALPGVSKGCYLVKVQAGNTERVKRIEILGGP